MNEREPVGRLRFVGDFAEAEVVRIFETAQALGFAPVMAMVVVTTGDGTTLRMNLHEGCCAGQKQPEDFDPGTPIVKAVNENLAKLPGLRRSVGGKVVS